MNLLKKQNFILICIVAFMLLFDSCKPQKEDEITPENSFDKGGMLTNVGTNIITPAYAKLKIAMDSLQFCNIQFISNPSSNSLSALQSKFSIAYIAYQRCSSYEFGPAESQMIRANFNIFPCDTAQINTNISNGSYNLATADNIDAKGLPAIDFLLFYPNQNTTEILKRFTTNVSAANAKTYLTNIINELKNKTDLVNSGWDSSAGNYITTFKNNTGSDIGGSIGMLVNQLNYDFELMKNAKIGIPLGKKTLGTPMPEKVEAFYSKKSLILITEQLKTIENIYLGRNELNVDGLGLDDYLVRVNAQHSSGTLNDVIKASFTSAKAKLALIPDPLSQAVISNAAAVDGLYAELQQLVVLLKVDMPSALGVLITYQDNDGD